MVQSLQDIPSEELREHLLDKYTVPEIVRKQYEEWLADMFLNNKSHNTIHHYAQVISDFLNYVSKPVKEITEADIRSYRTYLQSKGKSPTTIQNYLICVNSFLKHHDVIVRVYKYAPQTKMHKPECLTPEEIKKFIAAIDESVLDADEPDPELGVLRFKTLFTLLPDTGLRVSEACNLTKGDIDFRERLVVVRRGKGDKYREVPISMSTLDLLEKYWRRRKDKLPYAFEYKGRKLDRMVVWRMTKKIAHKAGIDVSTRTHGKNIYPHIFRHTFATSELKRLIHEGKGRMDALLVIKQVLGHARIETTMIYLTLLGEDIRDMMGR